MPERNDQVLRLAKEATSSDPLDNGIANPEVAAWIGRRIVAVKQAVAAIAEMATLDAATIRSRFALPSLSNSSAACAIRWHLRKHRDYDLTKVLAMLDIAYFGDLTDRDYAGMLETLLLKAAALRKECAFETAAEVLEGARAIARAHLADIGGEAGVDLEVANLWDALGRHDDARELRQNAQAALAEWDRLHPVPPELQKMLDDAERKARNARTRRRS